MGSSGQHNLGLGSTRHEGSAWTWVANVVCGQAGQEQMALQRRRSLRCVILGGLRWVGVRLGEGGGGGGGRREGVLGLQRLLKRSTRAASICCCWGRKGSLPCHAYQMATREEGFLRETLQRCNDLSSRAKKTVKWGGPEAEALVK